MRSAIPVLGVHTGHGSSLSSLLAIMPAMPNRWKPNVTVAALIERDGHFLLVEEDTSDGLRLNNPAGHLDPGWTRALCAPCG